MRPWPPPLWSSPPRGTSKQSHREPISSSLARCAATVAGDLGHGAPKLVGQGGGLEHLPHFRRAVEQAVQREMGAAIWISAAGDACQGALTMACELGLKPR